MRILFVTDYYLPHIGGVEKMFSTLAEQLVNDGNKVTFITWKYKKELPKRETINGVEIIRIASPVRMLFSIFGVFKIMKQARKHDLIHTSTYGAAIGSSLAGIFTRKKVVLTAHEVWNKLWFHLPYINRLQKTAFYLCEKFLYTLPFHRYVAVSDSTKQSLLESGIKANKVIRIYNGIDSDVPKWEKRINKNYTFLYYGRAGISKGTDLILGSLPTLFEQYDNVKVILIIAPQPQKVYSHIHQSINHSSYKNKVELYSNLPHASLLEKLLNCDCVLIPSYCEGFGFTAAESSAMGIPIISSGKGSLPEVTYGKVIEMKEQTAEGLIEAMKLAIDSKFDVQPPKHHPTHKFVEQHQILYNTNYPSP